MRYDDLAVMNVCLSPEPASLTLDQFNTAAQLLDRWREQVAPAYTLRQ